LVASGARLPLVASTNGECMGYRLIRDQPNGSCGDGTASRSIPACGACFRAPGNRIPIP
jgi:hypothetical protein